MNKYFNILRTVVVTALKLKTFIILMISIIVLSCAQRRSKPIEGAWDLVYSHRISGDTLTWKIPGDYTGNQLKIWTQDHFSFVGQYKSDTTLTDNYGGGTYTLDQNRYEETFLYSKNKSRVDSTLKILLEVKGDSLIQSWPVDDDWKIDKSNYRTEKYVRLD